MYSKSTLLMGLALLAPATAQDPVVIAAPQPVLQYFHLSAGTIQDLVAPPTTGKPFDVKVVLDGVQRTLTMQPHDVRAPHFQLLVDDGETIRQLPTPESVTYRGTVVGMPGSDVALSLVDGQLDGAVFTEDRTYWIMPANQAVAGLPQRTHVVASHDAYTRPGKCGSEHMQAMPALAGPGVPTPPNSANSICEVAVDVTNPGLNRMGGTTTAATNRVTSVMNVVDTMYIRDVQITKTISTLLIRTSRVYNSTSTGLLGEASNRWASVHAGIQRDLVHVFGGNPPGGILGIANLSVVCNQNRGTGVSWFVGGINGLADLVAHEMGHNWSAQHCDAFNPCLTMCAACPLGNLRFAPVSINAIVRHRNTRGCLGSPTPPTLTSLSPTSTTSHQPSVITLTGSDLDNVDSVTVGGTPVGFTVVNPTTLTFTPPTPFEITTHPVVASTGGLTSNPLNLQIVGNHPSVFVTVPFQVRGFQSAYTAHTDRNWLGTLFLSSSNTPSAFPPIVSLEIGANFTNLIEVATIPADNRGVASLTLSYPASVQPQIIFAEFVTYTATSTLPLETSNSQQIQIF